MNSRDIAESNNITHIQLAVVSAVSSRPGLIVSELAYAVGVTPSAAVMVLDQLEAMGTVVRERDHLDRRLVHSNLSPAGEELAARSLSHASAFRMLLDELSGDDRELMAGQLERLVQLVGAEGLSDEPVPSIIAGPFVERRV